jgi:hypothetical protein
MNGSPFSRDRDRPLQYYVIVLHASDVAEDARCELERGQVMWLRNVLSSQRPEG